MNKSAIECLPERLDGMGHATFKVVKSITSLANDWTTTFEPELPQLRGTNFITQDVTHQTVYLSAYGVDGSSLYCHMRNFTSRTQLLQKYVDTSDLISRHYECHLIPPLDVFFNLKGMVVLGQPHWFDPTPMWGQRGGQQGLTASDVFWAVHNRPLLKAELSHLRERESVLPTFDVGVHVRVGDLLNGGEGTDRAAYVRCRMNEARQTFKPTLNAVSRLAAALAGVRRVRLLIVSDAPTAAMLTSFIGQTAGASDAYASLANASGLSGVDDLVIIMNGNPLRSLVCLAAVDLLISADSSSFTNLATTLGPGPV